MDLDIKGPDGKPLLKTEAEVEMAKTIIDVLKPLDSDQRLNIIDQLADRFDLPTIKNIGREVGRFDGFKEAVDISRFGTAIHEPNHGPSLDDFMSRAPMPPIEIAPEVQRVFDEHNQWCEGQGGQLGPLVPLDKFIAERDAPASKRPVGGDGEWHAAVQRLAAMDETRAADPNFDGLMRTVEYRRVLAGAKKTYGDPDVMMRELDAIENEMKLAAEIRGWLDGPMVFEKPQGSAWHKIVEANRHHRVLTLKNDRAGGLGRADLKGDFDTVPKVFVVEHDWAKAFEGAQDYGGGEVHMPFAMCVFEFRISGRRVCALLGEDRAGVLFVSGSNDRWVAVGKPDTDAKLQPLLSKQVEAICIALDAEVAETQVERAPHKLNHARVKKGLAPLKDYHIVSLVRRSRAAPLPRTDDGTGPRWRVRLHFRRGHWRHYKDHKTWIRWMLCGDPDLGFIDKHYKL